MSSGAITQPCIFTKDRRSRWFFLVSSRRLLSRHLLSLRQVHSKAVAAVQRQILFLAVSDTVCIFHLGGCTPIPESDLEERALDQDTAELFTNHRHLSTQTPMPGKRRVGPHRGQTVGSASAPSGCIWTSWSYSGFFGFPCPYHWHSWIGHLWIPVFLHRFSLSRFRGSDPPGSLRIDSAMLFGAAEPTSSRTSTPRSRIGSGALRQPAREAGQDLHFPRRT